jgi:hypothetical protein
MARRTSAEGLPVPCRERPRRSDHRLAARRRAVSRRPCTDQFTNHMLKAPSLFEKGPLALVAGEGFEPRPLGYEPYDIGLCRLKPSLAGAVTSADRTYPISLRRLRLARLGLSRRVRFTNRFTKPALDLQFPHPRHSLATRGLRRARPYCKSSKSVRPFGVARVFALVAVHRDPARSDGVAARIAVPDCMPSSKRRPVLLSSTVLVEDE